MPCTTYVFCSFLSGLLKLNIRRLTLFRCLRESCLALSCCFKRSPVSHRSCVIFAILMGMLWIAQCSDLICLGTCISLPSIPCTQQAFQEQVASVYAHVSVLLNAPCRGNPWLLRNIWQPIILLWIFTSFYLSYNKVWSLIFSLIKQSKHTCRLILMHIFFPFEYIVIKSSRPWLYYAIWEITNNVHGD